jgi:hypothetical protein
MRINSENIFTLLTLFALITVFISIIILLWIRYLS